ncbi:MAG TPA: cohesin domain-containing protein [Burkholderiales bacterium]|nr:cohesin domain-containing protein [Burkholderiales bacterium]
MRKKRILGLLAVAGAGVVAAGLLLPERPQPDSAQPAKTEARSPSSDGRFAALPSRDAIGKPRGELFGFRSWAPSRPVVRAGPAAAPAAPAPPPMPYRIAGQVVHDGAARVVLARDDRVLTVREGEMLDDNYRVESIKADGVTLVYLPLGVREQLPVTATLKLDTPAVATASAAPETSSAAGGSRPAQLRWEGPERVQAGNNFNVALKLTSDQPVRASPLQLSFDAKLLEAVAVRPGGFFSDGSFTYRVNPGGSIFVGASGTGGAAADAEFLIVTFRPIRSGAAELKLSSLVLQGATGRAIAHEAPAAFRTAIIQ